MYGLVNKAVEDLATSVGGPELWERIAAKAGVDARTFVAMDAYPDEVTYRLVGAASDVLGQPAEAILEAFGEHWVLYTAVNGYGPLLDLAGSDLVEVLEHLDSLHARVGLTMPELRPPAFAVERLEAGAVRLRYASERDGLAPMVVGLLKGLAARFSTPVRVTHEQRRADGAEHDTFVVEPA